MNFVLEVLVSKKEEYETLLYHVNHQLAAGNKILRSDLEINSAIKSKASYEEKLKELNATLELLGARKEFDTRIEQLVRLREKYLAAGDMHSATQAWARIDELKRMKAKLFDGEKSGG